jgi:uncharacterized protein
MRIAIIGGGISGLSLAYYLLTQQENPTQKFEVTIFEKTKRLGGNVETFHINLNANKDDDAYKRWADMGVNDFNLNSYTEMVKLMIDVGYMENADDYFRRYALEDTCAYGNLSGTVTYTDDGEYNTAMPASIAAQNDRFQQEAPLDVNNKKYAYYSVERYVREKGYTDDFIYNNLYARINGMYFCNGAPGEMPFVGIMHYYILQEGYQAKGRPTPLRCYFKDGCSAWIAALYQKLVSLGTPNIVQFDKEVKIDTTIFKDGKKRLWVKDNDSTEQPLAMDFDCIVVATHADDAIHLFDDTTKIPRNLLRVLSSFNYAPATSVVHNDASVFQPNKNSWRTYNIHVYDFKHDLYGPYTINYLENKHQNDKTNPIYNTSEYPQMFVSLNPTSFPNDASIYDCKEKNGKAITQFKHQKLTIEALMAQEDLEDLQGEFGLFYCNGFAFGAGLHEECILLAKEICARICGKNENHLLRYNHNKQKREHFAPSYIIDAIYK